MDNKDYNLIIVRDNPPYILYQRKTTKSESLDFSGNPTYDTITYKLNPWLSWINKSTQEINIGYCNCPGFQYNNTCSHITKAKKDLQHLASKFLCYTYEEEDLWIGITSDLKEIPKSEIKRLLKIQEVDFNYKTTKFHIKKVKKTWLYKNLNQIIIAKDPKLKPAITTLKLYKLKHER